MPKATQIKFGGTYCMKNQLAIPERNYKGTFEIPSV